MGDSISGSFSAATFFTISMLLLMIPVPFYLALPQDFATPLLLWKILRRSFVFSWHSSINSFVQDGQLGRARGGLFAPEVEVWGPDPADRLISMRGLRGPDGHQSLISSPTGEHAEARFESRPISLPQAFILPLSEKVMS